MAGKRVIKTETERQILAEYASGERSSVIAKRHGVNRKTVLISVRRNGGLIRDQRSSSGRPMIDPKSYVSDVLAFRAKGMSQQQIADQLGMSQQVVSRVLRQNGLPTATKRAGHLHGMWKGGKTLTGQGYVQCMVSMDDQMAPMRSRSGYVLEHRLVVARALGRPLDPRESVHHINGDKRDNRLENLQLRQGQHGTGIVFVCADCGSRHVKAQALD